MFDSEGTSRFVSGAVLFPQRWSLLEKMGMDMEGIHKPVPRFAEEISKPVDGFMTRLKAGVVWTRSNWNIVDEPTMFQPLMEVRPQIFLGIFGHLWLFSGLFGSFWV